MEAPDPAREIANRVCRVHNRPMEKSEPRTEPARPRPVRPSRRQLIGSQLFIRLAVLLSLLLAAIMVASLYVHWRRVQEPSTAIVVIADPSWDGAQVIVDAVGMGSRPHRVQVPLDIHNGYQTPVFELPGRYDVKVMLHDRQEWAQTLEIDRFRGVRIDLPTFVEVIGDSTLDGGQVLISSKDNSSSGTLSADNKFRLVVPLYAGDYSLEVTRDGQVLDHSEFTVAPHASRQVDLRKR